MFFKKESNKVNRNDTNYFKSSIKNNARFTLMQDITERFPNDVLGDLQSFGYHKVVSRITKLPLYIYPFTAVHSVTKVEGLAGIVINPLTYLDFQVTVQLLEEVEESDAKHLDVLVQPITEDQIESVTYPNPDDLLNQIDDEDMAEMLIAQLENGEGIMALLASFAPLITELSYKGLRYLSYHNLLRSPVPIEIAGVNLGEVAGDLFVNIQPEDCVSHLGSNDIVSKKVKLKSEELIRFLTYIHGQVDDRFTGFHDEGFVGDPNFNIWIPFKGVR